MTKRKNWLTAATLAIMTAALSACSGGSSNVPTDGVLGEVPAIAAEYLPEINENIQLRFKSASQENAEKYAKKIDELEAKWEKAMGEAPSIEGKEIPLEVADGLPLAPLAPLKIEKVKPSEKNVVIQAKTTTKTTAPLDIDVQSRLMLLGQTSEGAPVFALSTTPFCPNQTLESYDYQTRAYKAGVEGTTSVNMGTQSITSVMIWQAPELWGKLAKVVIIDRESPAYQAAEQQLKALVDEVRPKK